MSSLILLAVGPVQDFIAQARRTRDLWYGSHLLSELCRAVARTLYARHARLIFPSLPADELLECTAMVRDTTGRPPVNVANKILAEFDGVGGDLARAAREALIGKWRALSGDVLAKSGGLVPTAMSQAQGADREAWNEQIDTLLEFNAVWCEIPADGGYAAARERCETALAARKNLRDFKPWTHQRGAVPKSSLDGQRETVLRPPEARDVNLVRRYRISAGEQLDAVGLVKRSGGEPEQFVPIGNVALAAWIDAAKVTAPESMKTLLGVPALGKLAKVSRPDIAWSQRFPRDAQVFLQDRWPSLAEEAELTAAELDAMTKAAGEVLKTMSLPHPYVACIVADGDGVGTCIDKLTLPNAHRTFSTKMAEFAERARAVVERDHRGLLVYSGGDDVLAFVTLPDALDCAKAMKKAFAGVMEEAVPDVPEVDRPTLSVGIGVGHLLESMGYLLELGREAEKLAKGSDLKEMSQRRNALAVVVDKRSGGKVRFRGRWPEAPGDRLTTDVSLLGDRLSLKKVYEIRRMWERMPEAFPPGHKRVMSANDDAAFAGVLRMEVERILARVEGGSEITPSDVGLDFPVGYRAARSATAAWIERMLVARMFAEATLRAKD